MLELFLFAMLNLVKLLCTFFSYLFFIFTEQHSLLLNMCCLQVTLLASFVKTWRGMLLQCGYRSTCADIKLRKLRSRGIRSVFVCYNKHIYNYLLELFLFAMFNLVKLLCTFFSYLFFIFTKKHNSLLNMCCLQVILLASFVKTWRGLLLQCGYRSTCADIKLRKLRSTCSADTEACAQIESSESGPLSMKSLLPRLFHWVWKYCWWGF